MVVFLCILFTNASQMFSQLGIHDPSKIIYCEGRYYIFGTGNGIFMASSSSANFDSWTEETSPFANGNPAWINKYVSNFNGDYWAPDVIYMNNQYYLYYSCSSWGTMNSCVGVATNKTLNPNSPDYNWVDQGDIGIHSPDYFEGGYWNVNAIDPAIMVGPDNRAWLLYGSFNKSGIIVTQVSTSTGKPIGGKISVANSYTPGATNDYFEGEGASMFYNNGFYYLIYNKGGCCSGLNSTYYMVMGRSASPTGPFYDKAGIPMKVNGATSGGTTFLSTSGRYVGPGHFSFGAGKMTYHYYDGNSYGFPRLKVSNLLWGSDGWPYAEVQSSGGSIIWPGTYKLINKNSNLALDAANCSSDDGTNVQQWTDLNNTCQSWTIKYAADDFFYIENRNSGDVLDVAACGFASGSNVDLWPNLGNWCQQWSFIDQGDGSYRIVNRNNGKDMEITDASVSSGANVQTYASSNHNCQKWYVTEVGEYIADGTYTFTNRNSGKVLDVINCDSKNGANIQQWTNLNNNCQQWVVTRKSNGYYTIKNANSGKMLDVAYCGTANGSNVDQWTDYNNVCQEWYFVYTGDGHFRIVNNNSKASLEVAYASYDNGANVQMYSTNMNYCQQWSLNRLKSSKEKDGVVDNQLLEISIYPNPVADYLAVKNVNKGTNYTIYNIDGSAIKCGTLNHNKINLSSLKTGIYSISFDQHTPQTFIKE